MVSWGSTCNINTCPELKMMQVIVFSIESLSILFYCYSVRLSQPLLLKTISSFVTKFYKKFLTIGTSNKSRRCLTRYNYALSMPFSMVHSFYFPSKSLYFELMKFSGSFLSGTCREVAKIDDSLLPWFYS